MVENDKDKESLELGAKDNDGDKKIDEIRAAFSNPTLKPDVEVIKAITERQESESHKTLRLYLVLHSIIAGIKEISSKVVIASSIVPAVVLIIKYYLPGV